MRGSEHSGTSPPPRLPRAVSPHGPARPRPGRRPPPAPPGSGRPRPGRPPPGRAQPASPRSPSDGPARGARRRALLPLVALYGAWRPLAFAVLFVLGHHFVAGTLDRGIVFEPDGGSAIRLSIIHGAYVLVAAALSLSAWRLQHLSRQGLVRALGDSD